jgi:hypothetical protein
MKFQVMADGDRLDIKTAIQRGNCTRGLRLDKQSYHRNTLYGCKLMIARVSATRRQPEHLWSMPMGNHPLPDVLWEYLRV